MFQESFLQGRSGAVMRAINILDNALWDLNARSVKLPLHRYLGGYAEDAVPAYASGGYYLAGKTPKKLGAEAIGTDVLLALDANNSWKDLPTALEHLKRYEKYYPSWIEEPFGPDDIDSHARLARATGVTVATGEIGVGRWYFKELMEKGGAAILQQDAAVCGGIAEWRRIAATAASYGVTVCPHWFHDLHVHLVASTPNARMAEFFTDDQVLNFRRLVDCQLEFKNGMLKLPAHLGLGFGFDEKAVARYSPDASKNPWKEIKK